MGNNWTQTALQHRRRLRTSICQYPLTLTKASNSLGDASTKRLDPTHTHTESLQKIAIANYDEKQRLMDDNLGLPAEIADVIGPDWRTVPHKFHGNLRHVRGNFPLVAKVVKTLMSANRNKAVPRKLDAAIRQYRTELHQPAFHDQAPVVTKDEQKIHKYVCNVAGFCVHGSEGVLIRAMHDQLLRALCATRLPTANKVGRAALADSNVVICVVSERTEAAAGPMPVGAAALAPIVTILNKWVYLGFVDLGTRGFQSQLLHRVDAGTVRVGSDKIAATLKRDWTFTNTWDFVRYLDKTGTWYLRVCTFSASSLLVGTLGINECSEGEMPPVAAWRCSGHVVLGRRIVSCQSSETRNGTTTQGRVGESAERSERVKVACLFYHLAGIT